MSFVYARMHPSEASVPTVSSFGVPWIASRSPPGQPGTSLVWWPDSASAQQPYGESGALGAQPVGDREAAQRGLVPRAADGQREAPQHLVAAAQLAAGARSGRP